MPAEKKKVNLVSLKTKFGQFLYNHYCCQSCYSIDKLAFGFACNHKFCLSCNGNQSDHCKQCGGEIENLLNDKLQNELFLHFDDLKSIMNINLEKVSNKLKQQNGQTNEQQTSSDKKSTNKDLDDKQEDKNKDQDEKMETDEQNENKEVQQVDTNDKSANKSNENDNLPANRSSKRQAARKTGESTSSPAKKVKEIEPATKNTTKPTGRVSRETSRTKEKQASTNNLKDMFDELAKDVPAEEAAETEKTVTKSTRKTDKSTKASAAKSKQSMVIISTSITENELKLLNKFAKKFNAKIVNEFSEEVTHLVTLESSKDSKLTTRTLKYLNSLLAHKWLLDFNWIKESMDKDKLMDEADYELLGITKQTKDKLGAPKRSRESGELKLFEGKQFYIDGKFGPKCGLTKNDYKGLVKVGGGDVIENEKEIDDDTYFIIEFAYMNKSKFKGRKNSLSTTDFLSCVSDFKFDY